MHLLQQFSVSLTVRFIFSIQAFAFPSLTTRAAPPLHLSRWPRNFKIFKLLLRAVKLTMLEPASRPHVTLDQLRQIITFANKLGPQGIILAVTVSFAFFGFFRQSNLAPPTVEKFNPLKHTTRQHVRFAAPGLVVTLPWTKTHQEGGDPLVIPLPSLPQDQLICPVNNYRRLLEISPTFHAKQPLLSLAYKPCFTIKDITEMFNMAKNNLDLSQRLTLHSLRKGGATAAAQAGASLSSIKLHGDWKSDAVWAYILRSLPEQSEVALKFIDFV